MKKNNNFQRKGIFILFVKKILKIQRSIWLQSPWLENLWIIGVAKLINSFKICNYTKSWARFLKFPVFSLSVVFFDSVWFGLLVWSPFVTDNFLSVCEATHTERHLGTVFVFISFRTVTATWWTGYRQRKKSNKTHPQWRDVRRHVIHLHRTKLQPQRWWPDLLPRTHVLHLVKNVLRTHGWSSLIHFARDSSGPDPMTSAGQAEAVPPFQAVHVIPSFTLFLGHKIVDFWEKSFISISFW